MLLQRNFFSLLSRLTSLTNNSSIMEKTRVIASRFQEIDSTVSALKETLSKYEHEYYEKSLVALIEEKNRLLQAKVQKAVEELAALERCSGTSIKVASGPFEKVSTEATTVPSAPAQGGAEDKKPKENKKAKTADKPDSKPKEAKKPAVAQDEGPVDVGRLDMRVGKIVEIKKHPDADSLYVEQVDIGKPNPITVVSGLVKHVPIEEMQNRLVVILCNLKPAKMRGITSEGMVMCASSPDKVEVLRPPATAVAGDLIAVPGYPRVPDAVMNPKKKIFETVAPDLKTDDDLCAAYKGVKLVVEGKGHVTADSLKGVNVK